MGRGTSKKKRQEQLTVLVDELLRVATENGHQPISESARALARQLRLRLTQEELVDVDVEASLSKNHRLTTIAMGGNVFRAYLRDAQHLGNYQHELTLTFVMVRALPAQPRSQTCQHHGVVMGMSTTDGSFVCPRCARLEDLRTQRDLLSAPPQVEVPRGNLKGQALHATIVDEGATTTGGVSVLEPKEGE